MMEEEEEEEEEGEEEYEEEEGEEPGEMERVVVVRNSPSNYSAMSYEMFVEEGRAGEHQDDNKELGSLAGSLRSPRSSRNSYRQGEEEEQASVHTNNSNTNSLGPRKVTQPRLTPALTSDTQTNLQPLSVANFVSRVTRTLLWC